MDIITIIHALLRWGVLALVGGASIALVIWIVYAIYKKGFHGEKNMTKKQGVAAFLLSCWLLLVLALTITSRGANYTGNVNIDYFSGYINAWNKWSISELQLILFNMLMFVPLGFLLPLLWDKAERFKVTFLASLGTTALIEFGQLLTGKGIFEVDDLFHNCLGSLFGYFCMMAILSIIRDKRIRFTPIAKVLILPCLIAIIIGGAFWVYESQPYGNLAFLPAAKQDMTKVNLTTDMTLPATPSSASVYRNVHVKDNSYTKNVAAAVADAEGITFSSTTRREGDNKVYPGKSAQGNAVQLTFFVRTGTWSFTTWEDAASLTKADVKSNRERYEDWFKKNGLLPDSAVFSVQNNDTLRWDAIVKKDLATNTAAFASGSVLMQFGDKGNTVSLLYDINWNEYVATENIISPKEAFSEVEAGKFEQYVPFQTNDKLYVENYELDYTYDTKGFYQPTYRFSGYINERENTWECEIPALK